MYNVIQVFLSFILTVLNVFTLPIFGNFAAKNEPLDPDNCRLNFAAIADVHMKDEFIRQFMVELGLKGMQDSDSRLDALVVSGDLTDHGEADEWAALAESFSKYDPADEKMHKKAKK